MGNTISKGINLFKRALGFGAKKSVRQLIGESKNGIKVFRYTKADGTRVTESVKNGHLYKTVTQGLARDIQGGAKASRTTVLNHESGITTKIDKTKNVLLSPKQCISSSSFGGEGFSTHGRCCGDGGEYNLLIPKTARYDITTISRNDFSPNIVSEACYVVGKDGTYGSIARTNGAFRTNQLIKQFNV